MNEELNVTLGGDDLNVSVGNFATSAVHVDRDGLEIDIDLMGLPGPRGDKGEKGDQGERGEKGDKGDKGDPGKDGVDGQSLSVGGTVNSLSALPPSADPGVLFVVGAGWSGPFPGGATPKPGDALAWDGKTKQWVHAGSVTGPAGTNGVDGKRGPGVTVFKGSQPSAAAPGDFFIIP